MKIAGMQLQDAGYKPEPSEGPVIEKSATNRDPRYPTLYVDDKELPAVSSKDVKDDCILVALIHVQRRSDEEVEENGKKITRCNVTFEIRKAAIRPYNSGEDDEEDASSLTDEELESSLKIPASKGQK